LEIEVAKLFTAMTTAYPNTQITSATVSVYVSMLKDIPLEILGPAIQQSMAESEFLPTIARIRDKALYLTRPVAPEPLEAWGIVVKEIQHTGFYCSPHFDDPVIAKAVDCIGWQTLCSSENQVADRAHFSQIYESLLRRAENDRRMLPAARHLQERAMVMIEERSIH